MRKRDRAYLFLKQQLLEQLLQPGAMVDVDAIAHSLGMSRTPVLEAITLLEREGYLVVVPQVGVFVRIAEANEIYQRVLARAVLEGFLAAHAASNVNESFLQHLEALLERMDAAPSPHTYAKLNREFHSAIHRQAGLVIIQRLVEELWDYIRYIAHADQLFADRSVSQKQHRAILGALRSKDPIRARKLMEKHVLRAAELFSPNVTKQQEDTTTTHKRV